MAKLVMITLLILTHQIMIIDCSKGVCIETEKQALVSFKRDLVDPQNVLSSWVTKEEDCCQWDRIVCDNVTGHIVELNLTGASLSGQINPSLLSLKHLTHLNLSNNNFEPGIQIPSFLGSLVSLRYLNLKDTGYFVGTIPQQLGNLSNLQHLEITGTNLLHSKTLHWISALSSLEYLYMSYMNLSESSPHWLLAINNLPSLQELYLPGCELRGGISLPPRVNLTSLRVLDLSSNSFQGNLPMNMANLTSIVSIDLSRNSLQGNVPMSMGNLCNLEKLDLSNNKHSGNLSEALESLSSGCLSKRLGLLKLDINAFSGHISDRIVEFERLSIISLASNNISGPVPLSLGSLSNLEDLDISSNRLTGVVSEAHFAGLVNLYTFRASGNSLTLRVNPDWVPPFQLYHLDLGSWNLGPHFPPWLGSQSDIRIIQLSNTGISGIIPDRLWNFSSNIPWLDLSRNQLRGRIPNLHNVVMVDLSSNEFTGPLPRISSELWWLDLSNNSLSGDSRGLLCSPKANNDKFSLSVLRLGGNLLGGEIPDCWSHWPSLTMIDLGNNNLSGDIPISIGLLQSLNSLNLRNNSLTGEIPNSLTNNRFSLMGLNLGLNKLGGSIPKWIGIIWSLKVLVLRSNSFEGHFPVELCELDNLQILDIAENNLSGTIPTDCFTNFRAMTDTNQVYSLFFYSGYYGSDLNQVAKESTSVVTKGREYQYDKILYLMTALDLSSNNFSGEIPEEVANLQALKSLNLSRNHLAGSIPSNIGNMSALESLDLSRNRLSGEIPESMSDLNFLNYLNLSYNDLSGEIPKSTQLQSLSSSSFIGNELLCGDPLPKKCRETSTENNQVVEDDDDDQRFWFKLGIGMGFGVSLVGVIAPLLIFKIWRRAYFWFFQEFIWCHILDGITRIKYKIGISTPAQLR